jgi:regulator of sirC expression with transglutaminase-like and TPR domain
LRARRRLARILRSEPEFDLIEASLWIAAEAYPDLDVDHELERVRLIAAEGARRVFGHRNPFARLDGLNTFLFEELGFRGNAQDYNNPLNCYINELLDRRLGIPLTMSMVYLDVARAAGFDARGVGLPGHFVVRLDQDERTLIADPYHGGQIITEEDCRQLVGRTTGRPSLFKRSMLAGTDNRSMLGRLLLNLKHIFVEREDYASALGAVERLLLIKPGDVTELRDRGFLKAHLGRAGSAIVDLEAYLNQTPEAPDADSVRGRVSWLRRKLSEM